MDFNPKTNIKARAAYEIAGVIFSFVVAVGAFVALALWKPAVLLILGGLCIVGFIVYVLWEARVDVLQHEEERKRTSHKYYHGPNAIYSDPYRPLATAADCTYCVAELAAETPAEEEEVR